jgi:hypothetical protein
MGFCEGCGQTLDAANYLVCECFVVEFNRWENGTPRVIATIKGSKDYSDALDTMTRYGVRYATDNDCGGRIIDNTHDGFVLATYNVSGDRRFIQEFTRNENEGEPSWNWGKQYAV